MRACLPALCLLLCMALVSASQPRLVAARLYPLTPTTIDHPLTTTLAYRNDFEGAVGPEWSKTATDVTPLGARRFLGQFGAETVRLKLTGLPTHTAVTVSFDVYIIRSWDGNRTEWWFDRNGLFGPMGPDVWTLSETNGPRLLTTTFSNLEEQDVRQAYPDVYPGGDHPAGTGAAEKDSLGYDYSGDSVYRLRYSFLHTTDVLSLDFSAAGLQPSLQDESWGLDSVEVSLAGQGAEIRGVAQSLAGLPIPGAIVTLSNGLRAAPTDARGQYVLQGVPVGNYTIQAEALSYRLQSHFMAVTDTTTRSHDFTLSLSDPRQALVERFAPILYMHPDDWVKEPKAVDVFVQDAALKDAEGLIVSPRGEVSSDTLATRWPGRLNYSLDLRRDVRHDPVADFKQDYLAREARYPAVTYASVMTHTFDHSKYWTTVQYWFFYYYNDWLNQHEGDWESITLVFETDSAAVPTTNVTPTHVAYSQHNDWLIFDGREVKTWSATPTENGQPIVYVARGSHASYFSAGSHLFWLDQTSATGEDRRPTPLLIQNGELPGSWGPAWIHYQGAWGQKTLFPWSSGPASISAPSRDKFHNPLCWVMGDLDRAWRERCRWSALEEQAALDRARQGVWSATLTEGADLHVYDSQGRHIGVSDLGTLESSLPDAYLFQVANGQVALLTQPDQMAAPMIRIKGRGANTIRLTILAPSLDGETARRLEYNDIPTNDQMQADVILTPDGTLPLRLDLDGNGIVDTEKMPDVNSLVQLRPHKVWLPLIDRSR